MASDEVKQPAGAPRTKLSEAGVKLVILVVGASCAGVTLAVPRPVAPLEPPSLVLPRDALSQTLEADARAEKGAPHGELVATLDRLYREQGAAEAGKGEPSGAPERRRAQIRQTVREIAARFGHRALTALRARTTEQAEAALAGRRDETDQRALLGSFRKMLARYGLSHDGQLLAPRLVVRSLYKARWNGICGLRLTDGLRQVELRAYWGWLALDADSAPLEQREQALARYAKLGGRRLDEARGVLAFLGDRYGEAAVRLRKAYAQEGTYRLRNEALAAGAALGDGQ